MHYDEYSATDLMTEEELAEQERQDEIAYGDYRLWQVREYIIRQEKSLGRKN